MSVHWGGETCELFLPEEASPQQVIARGRALVTIWFLPPIAAGQWGDVKWRKRHPHHTPGRVPFSPFGRPGSIADDFWYELPREVENYIH